MGYTKTNWVNNSSPYINADNLNHIEEGIEEITNGTVIYDNSTGAIGTDIDFETAISEFSTIKIIYNKGLIQNIDVASILNKNIDVPISMYWHDGTGAGGIFGAFYYLTDTQLIYRNSLRFFYYSGTSTPSIDTNTSIYIYKIIAYK